MTDINKETHLAAGVAFSVLAACSAPQTVLVCFGSLLPDIDCKTSTLGKKAKFIGFLLKHRTFTHSILFVVLTAFISPYIALGALSHIILDMFNPQGVELLFPFGRKLSFPWISGFFPTGSFGEDIFRYVMYIIIALSIIAVFQQSQMNQLDMLKNSLLSIKDNSLCVVNFFQQMFAGIFGSVSGESQMDMIS